MCIGGLGCPGLLLPANFEFTDWDDMPAQPAELPWYVCSSVGKHFLKCDCCMFWFHCYMYFENHSLNEYIPCLSSKNLSSCRTHVSLQEEYYLTHQCFFTNRALYLLVWNVIDGADGIKSLTVWLQNLQVPLTRCFSSQQLFFKYTYMYNVLYVSAYKI